MNRKLVALWLAALAAFFIACAPAHADYQFGDNACETTTDTGTGTIDLDGALSGGYLPFADVLDDGDTFPYHIKDGSQLETGTGTFHDGTPDTMDRVADWSTDGAGAELTLSGATATVCIGPITSLFTGGVASFSLSDLTLGGLDINVADAGADAIFGWDDSDAAYENLTAAEAADALGNEVKKPGTDTIFIPINATFVGSCAPGEYTDGGWVFKYAACDASSAEFMVVNFIFPKGWDEGNITATFYWSHPSTTTNFAVVWGISCNAVSNDDSLAGLGASYTTVTDTGGTTADLYVSDATSGFAVAGTPAEGDLVACALSRRAADGSDTLAVDAYLHGVKLSYQSNAANDD
jgi:hypothetical protein